MKDILKTYCKVPRGFVKAKGRDEQTRCTHVKCEIMYELGGHSLFTGQTCKRGYYLHVTPVEVGETEGVVFESFAAFTGGKFLLVECARRSSRKETLAKVMYEKIVRSAVRQLFDDPETIDMSGLPDLDAGLNRSGA